MSQAINEFVENMNSMLAFEYGDFKRKAGNYLNRLEELESNPSPQFRKTIAEVRDYLIYSPRFELEEARQRAISDIQSL